MSFFDEVNQDALRGTIDTASVGPRLGFQEAFSAAWDATTKAHAALAVEQGIRAKEQAQIKMLRENNLRPPDSLDDSESSAPILGGDNSDRNPLATTFRQGRYSAAAQSIIEGGGWYTDEMVAARDEHLRKLQQERPDLGIQTYGEMFKSVQTDAQEAEKRAELPKTALGHIGAFIGEAAGSLDPVSNPLNFATLGIGGGTGIAGRAAVQGAVQGSAEAINLAASEPENILLGRPRAPGEDVGRIGMAMAAGAGADLLFSGAGAAIRRTRTGKWFVDQPLPEPPPPRVDTQPQVFQGANPPPPKAGLPLHEYPDWETFARAHGEEPNAYGPSPEAKRRTAADLNYVSEELNRWDGPAPWELRPPSTDTALSRVMGGPDPGVEINIAPGAYTRYLDNLETVHDIARRIDPDLFRQYDVLQQQIVELRGAIEREKGVQTFFDADETARRARELSMRQQIQKYDQQMRDMAPLVSRAYGLAEKEWRTTPLDHDTIEFYKSIEESGARWHYRPDPPQREKTVRFYHGGSTEKPNEGRWVTEDLRYAEGYASKSGDQAAVWYVDLPESHPALANVGRSFEAEGTGMRAPFAHFEMPADVMRDAKMMPRTLTEQPPRPRMRDPETVWSSKDYDIPVEKIDEPAARGSDGRMYQKILYKGKESYVPADELKVREKPGLAPTTVDDAVPLASMEPGIDNRLHVDTDTAAARVKQNVEHTIEKLDEKVEQFATHAEKLSKLEAKDIAEQSKLLEEKLAKLREQRSAAASNTGITEAFKDMGASISENFYRQAFEAYRNGGSRVAGINEPKLVQARRGGVEFSSPSDVRAYYEGKAVDSPVPAWQKANAESAVELARALKLTDKVRELATAGKTAREISEAVNGRLTPAEVRAVRDHLGIEGGQATAFGVPIPKANADARARMSEAIAKVEKELDELHYVTFPDGRRLHLDNDRAPFVHDDGRVEEMSVRDFMREMAKDQDALKSVVSCSRPS